MPNRFLLSPLAILWVGVCVCQSPAPLTQKTFHEDQGIYRITAREVSVDVVALNERGQPVLDLMPAELHVSESYLGMEGDAPARNVPVQSGTIRSLHTIDPNAPRNSDDSGGVHIAASCLERSAVHYRLAFTPGPDGWRSGYHQVMIATTRRGIRLTYRHRYYVGLTEPPATESQAIEKRLLQSSCYYPEVPPSIALRARRVDKGRTDLLSFSVSIDASSLSYLTIGAGPETSGGLIERRVALDYAICSFDAHGRPLKFSHAPMAANLGSAEYARALDRGFSHVVEFPPSERMALTRVVVRDRATGNLGAIDLPNPEVHAIGPGGMPDPEEAEDAAIVAAHTKENLETLEGWLRFDGLQMGYRGGSFRSPLVLPVPAGPIGSFGSIVPTAHAFCGDVYELPRRSVSLPDFRELDPIGSIYAATLDVPNQVFENTSGIPGVTPRTNQFGIDYHGTLQIAEPGEYKFLMLSDDGAILRIDDRKVIDLDGLHNAEGKSGGVRLSAGSHAIEVQYYQGAVNAVALELWVKPPKAHNWTLLNLQQDVVAESAVRPELAEEK